MSPLQGWDLAQASVETTEGDEVDVEVTAGEIDRVGPVCGTTNLRSYFEALHAGNKSA